MLLRHSTTGKILIVRCLLCRLFCSHSVLQNFNLYSGLKVTQSKRALTFVGHNDGISQTYSVRLQNEEQATTLKDVLEKEIASVKPS